MSLSNTQYDEIMRGYQQRQIRRQHEISARRDQVAAAAPEIADIDGEIASLSVKKARQLLNGEAETMEDLRRQISELSLRRAETLRACGYDPDFLNPPYECNDCRDTGYIGNERCHCFKQAAIDLVYRQSNLTDLLQAENFDTFHIDYYPADLMDAEQQHSSRDLAIHAFSKCREFTEHFDERFDNLLLYGDTGVGKTFLSNCVANELLKTGHSVLYFTAHDLFEVLAQKMRKNTDTQDDYQNIFHCDLLIIDDLGTEMSNTFTSSEFFVCLNERIRCRRSTLISTNLGLSDIAGIYSERVVSRIYDSFTMLYLFGKDIRIQKKLQRL